MPAPWPRDYTPSDWDDPLDDLVRGLMGHYNSGVPRRDLDAVERLARSVTPQRVPRHVVVVGTNGKGSTAQFLARLLHEQGVRVGLYTSPHIRHWNERIRIDLRPVSPASWRDAVLSVDRAVRESDAPSGALRFFDVLTLAAEKLFVEAGVEVGIFEAGIGGRLDAVRVLEPRLTLLTSIGRDHEEILGRDPRDRLREKVGVAADGGSLIASALGDDLAAELTAAGRERGLAITLLPAVEHGARDDGVPAFQRSNARLAEAGARWVLGGGAGRIADFRLSGRFEHGKVGAVAYVADVAHNPTACDAFLSALPTGRYELVTAITPPRSIAEFVEVLAAHSDRIAHLTVTGIRIRPAQDPGAIARNAHAAGIDAVALADTEEAFAAAAGRALAERRTLVVFGSNYLVVDFLAWAARAADDPAYRGRPANRSG